MATAARYIKNILIDKEFGKQKGVWTKKVQRVLKGGSYTQNAQLPASHYTKLLKELMDHNKCKPVWPTGRQAGRIPLFRGL